MITIIIGTTIGCGVSKRRRIEQTVLTALPRPRCLYPSHTYRLHNCVALLERKMQLVQGAIHYYAFQPDRLAEAERGGSAGLAMVRGFG